MLLDAGVDVTSRDSRGNGCLHVMILTLRSDLSPDALLVSKIISLLIGAGASVDDVNDDGWSALRLACYLDFEPMWDEASGIRARHLASDLCMLSRPRDSALMTVSEEGGGLCKFSLDERKAKHARCGDDDRLSNSPNR